MNKVEEEEEEEDDEEEGANNAWANGEGPDGMGCTAVVALVLGGEHPEVWCANAGDSRCVLARGAKALNMSRDHKPALKCELDRIKKAGGYVTAEGRVDGNLNLSRALGDFAYKKDKSLKPVEQKISCEAEVRRKPLGDADRYLLIGCDGIFEKASSQALVDFMHPRLGRLQTAHRRGGSAQQPVLSSVCSAFLDHNIAKVPSKEEGLGCDNMTLMVIDLRAGGTSSSAPGKSPAAGKAAAGRTRNGSKRPSLMPGAGRCIVLGVRRTAAKGRLFAVCSVRRRRLLAMAQRHRREGSTNSV